MVIVNSSSWCWQDVCEILKNAVRTLLSDCASLMTSIAGLVVNMYQSHAHPVILDISKQVRRNQLSHGRQFDRCCLVYGFYFFHCWLCDVLFMLTLLHRNAAIITACILFSFLIRDWLELGRQHIYGLLRIFTNQYVLGIGDIVSDRWSRYICCVSLMCVTKLKVLKVLVIKIISTEWTWDNWMTIEIV